MKVIQRKHLEGTDREVHCPQGGFISYRYLLAKDGMGFSVHQTVIKAGRQEHWHYLNHVEACYCVSGYAEITDRTTGHTWSITPGTLYALDKHDDHLFVAIEDTTLISIFNPPVVGPEVHDEERSYPLLPYNED